MDSIQVTVRITNSDISYLGCKGQDIFTVIIVTHNSSVNSHITIAVIVVSTKIHTDSIMDE